MKVSSVYGHAINLFLNLQESWAICRIFKKTNSTAQRAMSHSWVSPFSETRTTDMLSKNQETTQFCSENMSLTKNSLGSHLFSTENFDNIAPYKSIINPLLHKAFDFDHLPISNGDLNNNTSLIFSPTFETCNTNVNVSSMLLNMSSSSVLGEDHATTNFNMNGGLPEVFSTTNSSDYYQIPFLREMQGTFGSNQHVNYNNNNALVKIPYNVNVPRVDDQELETVRLNSMMHFNIGDAWKSNLLWDASSCPCDVPSSYSTTKCYT